MKKCMFAALLMALSLPAQSQNDLWENFQNPPQEARPQVWWHWMDGNITKDGIRKDLEWMHRAGIGGIHCFEAGASVAQVVDKRLAYMSEEWKDAFRYAMHLADSLGLEVAIASCPGWSNTGGPWVTPEQAMKRLVWTETHIKGGRRITQLLPQPEVNQWYGDSYVVAVKLPESDRTMEELGAQRTLIEDPYTVQYSFPKPVTIRSLSIADGESRTIWAALKAPVIKHLEVSEDGWEYRRIADIPNGSVSVQTIETEPTTGRFFRIVYDRKPRTEPEVTLRTSPRINHAEEKAGFATPSDMMEFETSPGEGIPVSDVIDLTANMSPDGTLHWKAPKGRWLIYRFGYTLTGKKNHPAPPEATGLEVTKLDPEAFRSFLTYYLDMYRDASGGMLGEKGIKYLLIDSYEAGPETWTPRMAEEFAARRGYSLIPWMPVLTGQIVGSAQQSEEFLFDWRTTIGELIEEGMYSNAAAIAREYGLKTYFESHENGRLYLVDGMSAKSKADIPMAAMWVVLNDGPKVLNSSYKMGQSDIRESASVAHLYGKKYVAAESLTVSGNAGGAYSFYPGKLKPTADAEMASGVNRFVIHESAHQPVDDKRPGLGLGQYGQWFNRHETWAEQARAWTDYLARSCYMLQQGQNVADVLFYYGEDDVVTSLFAHRHPDIPAGYNYDFINKEALLSLLSYDGQYFLTPSGAAYRVLIIDERCIHFSPEVLSRLEEWRKQGAPVFDLKECSVGDALEGIAPDFDASDMTDLCYVHRTTGTEDIYWIMNGSFEPRSLDVSFRTRGLTPTLWHPETGTAEPLSYHIGERTFVHLDLTENDAVFVVFSGNARYEGLELPSKTESLVCTVGGPWKVSFEMPDAKEIMMDELKPYTEYDAEAVKYFSGTAVYTNSFSIPERRVGRVVIDLGEVHSVAEVSVNGKPAGVLWKSPYRADITDLVRPGENELEVRVVNEWVNRIIGDLQPTCPQKVSYTHYSFYKADSPLLPAGLLGPVEIVSVCGGACR